MLYWLYTVKPVNKGHPRERQDMVFIDKWSLFGGFFVLFNEGCDHYLQDGLFWEVLFNTGLTVHNLNVFANKN